MNRRGWVVEWIGPWGDYQTMRVRWWITARVAYGYLFVLGYLPSPVRRAGAGPLARNRQWD